MLSTQSSGVRWAGLRACLMFSVNVIGIGFRTSRDHQPAFCAIYDPDFDLVQVYLCGRFIGFAHNFEQAVDLLHDRLDNQTVLG